MLAVEDAMTFIHVLAALVALMLSAGQAPANQRFDYLVRGDFFAGMAARCRK